VAAELIRLQADHQSDQRLHAAARTLNLVITPCRGNLEDRMIAEVKRLGSHTPARTIVLRDHPDDRLDAEVVIDCETGTEGGQLGICHDRIVLDADGERLTHADSLVAPLLVTDLPTVVWLADPAFEAGDARLVERAQHVVLDSAAASNGLEIAARIAERAPISDLAWIRLERWRVAVASAWDPQERRALLPALEAVEVRHGEGHETDAALAAGWIAARSGLERAAISLAASKNEVAIESIRFRAGSQEFSVRVPTAGLSPTEQFARALILAPAQRRGYPEALAAAGSIGAPA
jgi:glucose-6-phosphate dehydrogenase assembly protein OpcA